MDVSPSGPGSETGPSGASEPSESSETDLLPVQNILACQGTMTSEKPGRQSTPRDDIISS